MTRATISLLLCSAACGHLGSKEVPPPQHVEPTAPAKAAPPAEKTVEKPTPPRAPPAAPTLAGEEVLAQQPALGPIARFDAPVPRVEKLPNGMPLYIVERPNDGIEAVQLWIRGGASSDPAARPGLASITAALMESGAAGRSQTEIAAAADAIGMSLSVNATQEATVVSGSAMVSNLAAMAKLLGDVALRPNLDGGEFAKVRDQRVAGLIAQRAEPAVAARRNFRLAVYEGTPMGRPVEGTVESVQALTVEEVKRAYAAFGPANAALVAVGGSKAGEVVAALRNVFGGWKPPGAKPAQAIKVVPPAARPRLVFCEFPGKPQSVIVAGQPIVPRKSPDYVPIEVLNSVLGGSFTSRLNQNLREKNGYSYGVGSRVEWLSTSSPFTAAGSVKTEVTGPALKEILLELGRSREPLEKEELEKGRALLVYQLAETISHATALAPAIAQIWLDGLPRDEYRTYAERLQAVTVEAVQAAAKRTLDPDRMTISIAGDKEKVLPQLEPLSLGKPQLRDASGKRLDAR